MYYKKFISFQMASPRRKTSIFIRLKAIVTPIERKMSITFVNLFLYNSQYATSSLIEA